MRITSPKDFWAGLLFGGLGLFVAIYAAEHYNMGTAVRMGPAYFPTWIGAAVAILGLVLILRSFRIEGSKMPRFHWRPLVFVLGGSVVYGYMLDPLGLPLATILLVFITAFGGHEFRWREVLILAIVLAIFSSLVFVYGLGLPFPLWPEILD